MVVVPLALLFCSRTYGQRTAVSARSSVVDGSEATPSTNTVGASTAEFDLAAEVRASKTGRLFLPCGTYRLKDALGLANFELQGESENCVTILAIVQGDVTRYLIDGRRLRDASSWSAEGIPANTKLSGFTVDCGGKGWSGLRAYYGPMNQHDIVVRNCYDGFRFDEPYMASFHNLRALNNTHDGFVFANSEAEEMTSLDIQNIWAESNGRYGVNFGASAYTSISNSAAQTSRSDDWHFDGTMNGAVRGDGLIMSGCASESAGGRSFYFRRYRGVVLMYPMTSPPPKARAHIEFDDTQATVIGYFPASLPVDGSYHVDSYGNTTGLRGVVTFIDSSVVVKPDQQDQFTFINTANNLSTAMTQLHGRLTVGPQTTGDPSVISLGDIDSLSTGIYRRPTKGDVDTLGLSGREGITFGVGTGSLGSNPTVGKWTAAGLTIGSGTALSRYARYSKDLSPMTVKPSTCEAQRFSIKGIARGDILVAISKPSEQAGLSVAPGHVVDEGVATINFCNNSGLPVIPTANETYTFVVVQ